MVQLNSQTSQIVDGTWKSTIILRPPKVWSKLWRSHLIDQIKHSLAATPQSSTQLGR